ncbi:transglycosylase SLT domain-containing protein [Burkholderia ubonensis]|uniref:transglycosylase SLT domain-containing protein n=1 Tax=Burkholderia ubonensis TaxID=101571 RepID=UPI00075A989C|nr:transglycosylase SLT domain-containing protein [Burkholderia ubonensis]
MQFLVKRCVRNQVILAASGLLLAAGLLYSFVWVLQTWTPPIPTTAQREVTGVIEKPRKSVEQRKQAITSYLATRYKQHSKVVRSYVDLAWRESAKHPGVEPELILAVIQKESSLSAKASNSYGAQGLMQVVRRWHPEKVGHKESLMDPRVNIRVGAQILKQYIDEKGRIEPALVKYSGNASGYADFVMREKRVLQEI